jgi:hypothetical protein
VSAERWTQEQFEDHWYRWAPRGSLGRAVRCDCGEDHCHGWRMIVTHLPNSLTLLREGDPGVITMALPVPAGLHAGETLEVTWTLEMP